MGKGLVAVEGCVVQRIGVNKMASSCSDCLTLLICDDFTMPDGRPGQAPGPRFG